MINIYSGGEKITYTAGDSFEISVSSVDGFSNDVRLKFQVAKNESESLLIDAVFELDNDEFSVVLTDEEKEKLIIGDYVYKLVLVTKSGEIVTQKSGELIVKWGA